MIKFENINKTYPGIQPLHVLKGIDMNIDKGEFVSIMGASGSGKSTMLNILGILDDYDTGNYYLNGTLIKNLSEKRSRRIPKPNDWVHLSIVQPHQLQERIGKRGLAVVLPRNLPQEKANSSHGVLGHDGSERLVAPFPQRNCLVDRNNVLP